MGTNSLFLNIASINNGPDASAAASSGSASSSGYYGNHHVPAVPAMVVSRGKSASSTGSFAVRRSKATAAAAGKPVTVPGAVIRFSKLSQTLHSAIPATKGQTSGKRVSWGPVSAQPATTTQTAGNKVQSSSTKANKLQTKKLQKSTIAAKNSSTESETKSSAAESKPGTNEKKDNDPTVAMPKYPRNSRTGGPTKPNRQFTGNSNYTPLGGGGEGGQQPPAGAPKGEGHVVSLFTGNPDIPQLEKADITPITEEVFSKDAFSTLNLSPVLVPHMSKLGFRSLTVVQQRGIPPILQGRDVLIKSQTGSGKTLAYALPIINSLITAVPTVERSHGVLAVVVVPTRELALQTYNWIHELCRACVSIVPGYLMGGEKKKSEKNRLRRGVNILVATPGRLLDHIDTTECLALRNVRFLVLDEADRMLEMGYEKNIANITDAIIEARMHGDHKRFQSKKTREAGGVRPPALGEKSMKRKNESNEEETGDYEDAVDSKKLKASDGSAIAVNNITSNDDDGNNEGDDDDSEDERPNEDIDDVETLDTSKLTVVEDAPAISIKGGLTTSTATNSTSTTRLQTIMLSATLSEQVQRLAGVNLHNPEVVAVSGGGDSEGGGVGGLDSMGDAVVMPELLVHHYCIVPAKLRLVALVSFILGTCLYGKHRKMVVFMATQDMVDYHTALLQRLLARYGSVEKQQPEEAKSELEIEADRLLADIGGSSNSNKRKRAAAQQQAVKEGDEAEDDTEPLIHFMELRGNMSQSERTKVFNRFREAASGVLLCTDVASRGLDMPKVSWIVQYTAAGSVTDYVHRVGRTSRANTRGDALLLLAPSEVGYVAQLERCKITLEEMDLKKLLGSFTLRPPRMDPKFKVPRSYEEGATNFQLQCETLLLREPSMLDQARRAYISFVRAYASYPVSVRDVFSFKDLHLGHYAKSFALREAPTALGASAAYKAQAVHRVKKERKDKREKVKLTGVMAQKRGAVPSMASMSEFDSGLDGLATLLTQRRTEQTKRHNHLKTNSSSKHNHNTKTTDLVSKNKAANTDKKNKKSKKPRKVISTKVKKSKA